MGADQATSASAVSGCALGNSARSVGVNSASPNCAGAQAGRLAAPPATATGTPPPSAASCSPATHGTRSSSLFHSPPSDAAGHEHPGDLRQRAGQVEPVQRLRAQHRVDRRVGQRYLPPRCPASGAHRRQRAAQFGEHRRVRLDRRHVRAEPRRGPRSACPVPAPRSSTRSPAMSRPRGRHAPAHRIRRVVRPVLGVRRRHRAERRSPPGPLVRVSHAPNSNEAQPIARSRGARMTGPPLL